MPDYVFYDPNSTPVANRVRDWRHSLPEDSAAALASARDWNYFQADFDVTALPPETRNRKVVNGVIVDFDAADLAAIAAANVAAAAAQLAALKAEAKERLVLQNDFREAFEAFAEIVVSEINILRAQHGLAARTPAQVKTAFKAAYDGKVDLWT